jgi:hypothetical protein
MGFISKNNKVVLSAFLTQKGREAMINGSLEDFQVKYYGMSDPDVNYLVESNLSSGLIPDLSGSHEGLVKSLAYGVTQKYTISGGASLVEVNNLNLKPVEGNSTFQKTLVSIPEKTITAEKLKFTVCDTNLSPEYSNLLVSFGLPVTESQKSGFVAKYKNTAIEKLANIDKFVIGEVSRECYGEIIDGKTIELNLGLSINGKKSNIKLYSTYFGFNEGLNAQLSDTSTEASSFNSNIAFLFSNEIATPKDKVVKSTLVREDLLISNYGTRSIEVEMTPEVIYDLKLEGSLAGVSITAKVSGSEVTIPFNNAVEMVTESSFKPLFPISSLSVLNANPSAIAIKVEFSKIEVSSANSWAKWTGSYQFPVVKGGFGKATASFKDSEYGLLVDEPVGIVYLDKGLVVLTDPSIVNNLDVSNEATDMIFKSVVTEFSQSITCVALPDEFYHSINPTFSEAFPQGLSNTDYVYITEIGLYNTIGDLIAIAKTSEPVKKNKLNVALFSVKLKL